MDGQWMMWTDGGDGHAGVMEVKLVEETVKIALAGVDGLQSEYTWKTNENTLKNTKRTDYT